MLTNEEIIMCQMMDKLLEATTEKGKKIIKSGNTEICIAIFSINKKPHHYIISCNTIKVVAMI